ncbi:hypothetical protein BJ508DRAFT_380713 [Ascobolus immersus RN42]|uniref:Uncharacterized protein n=1 Tax=Ascobolus immersus RN42 TaxID=1160509 RepID=A0A3N4HNZ2_ASCIM|nr:hypothetical protein BJ508DRAFT_380713 [Ascobolus immersus RN42]
MFITSFTPTWVDTTPTFILSEGPFLTGPPPPPAPISIPPPPPPVAAQPYLLTSPAANPVIGFPDVCFAEPQSTITTYAPPPPPPVMAAPSRPMIPDLPPQSQPTWMPEDGSSITYDHTSRCFWYQRMRNGKMEMLKWQDGGKEWEFVEMPKVRGEVEESETTMKGALPVEMDKATTGLMMGLDGTNERNDQEQFKTNPPLEPVGPPQTPAPPPPPAADQNAVPPPPPTAHPPTVPPATKPSKVKQSRSSSKPKEPRAEVHPNVAALQLSRHLPARNIKIKMEKDCRLTNDYSYRATTNAGTGAHHHYYFDGAKVNLYTNPIGVTPQVLANHPGAYESLPKPENPVKATEEERHFHDPGEMEVQYANIRHDLGYRLHGKDYTNCAAAPTSEERKEKAIPRRPASRKM